MTDWRLQGQEKFLKGVKLVRQVYMPDRPGWEHNHCEFCSRNFSLAEGDLHEGYATIDRYHWICEQCYEDFKDKFNWRLVNE